MKTYIRFTVLASALAFALPLISAHAATLTYHGTLQDAGKPANGAYDIQLSVYSVASGGRPLGAPVTLYAVPVKDGHFSTEVDLGANVKSDGASWVATSIRPAGTGDFSALDTRTAAAIDAPSTCNGSWALDGNAGNPPGSYLGTADDQPLVLMANGHTLGTFTGAGNGTTDSVALGHGTSAPGYANFAAGAGTTASGDGATAFGDGSVASGNVSMAAGYEGSAGGQYSVVAGGSSNTASGTGSAVAGGASNFVSGTNAFIAGGANNSALGVASFAGGQHAAAIEDGSFVWADYSSGFEFEQGINSPGNKNEFLVRSLGGVYFVTATDPSGGNQAGVQLAPGGGSWSSLSDRRSKSDLLDINAQNVLNSVLNLPISTWRYVAQSSKVRHIGPMAQDFYAAFDVGEDNRHITEVDEGGVALAAIQGLNKKLETENASLHTELAELRSRVDKVLAAKGE